MERHGRRTAKGVTPMSQVYHRCPPRMFALDSGVAPACYEAGEEAPGGAETREKKSEDLIFDESRCGELYS